MVNVMNSKGDGWSVLVFRVNDSHKVLGGKVNLKEKRTHTHTDTHVCVFKCRSDRSDPNRWLVDILDSVQLKSKERKRHFTFQTNVINISGYVEFVRY